MPHVHVLPSAKTVFNGPDVKTSAFGENEERWLICRQIVLSGWHRLLRDTTERITRSCVSQGAARARLLGAMKDP